MLEHFHEIRRVVRKKQRTKSVGTKVDQLQDLTDPPVFDEICS